MGMVFNNIKMERNMRGNGWTTFNMDLEMKFGQIKHNIKATFNMVKDITKENLCGQMVLLMKAIFSRVILKVIN